MGQRYCATFLILAHTAVSEDTFGAMPTKWAIIHIARECSDWNVLGSSREAMGIGRENFLSRHYGHHALALLRVSATELAF